jgi:hypothetical protein
MLSTTTRRRPTLGSEPVERCTEATASSCSAAPQDLPLRYFRFRISSSSLLEAAPILKNRMSRTAAICLLVQIDQTEVIFFTG